MNANVDKVAKQPFRFKTTSLLVEITGKKAHHLKEFVIVLKEIDVSSVFYHTHHSFREFSFAPQEFTNDFARWVSDDLEEKILAERLASINIGEYTELEFLRARLVNIIVDHLIMSHEIRIAPPGREFYFLRSIGIVANTPFEAGTLKELAERLKKVDLHSIYFHFFSARFRLHHKTNDFSKWIRENLDDNETAEKIEKLDPYFMTMEQLRHKIISICLGENE
jgi:MoaA/NifB/PqqE/SkfB family radical SAM enzyme